MAVEVILVLEAELDVAEAYGWYETRRPGLGDEFLGCVEAVIERIRRTPLLYPVVHESYRRALVRRFPYALFYEVAGETATVFCVFHASRDRSKWRQRLP